MQVTTFGLDLTRNIIQLHGITADGMVAFNKSLRRSQLLQFFEELDPCLIGMETLWIEPPLGASVPRTGP